MTDLLLVVPHPDDEVFGSGGVLARMVANGRRVATLTLTRGRAGRTLDLCTREALPSVREAELRGSLAALGVEDVTILDYPDFVPDADRGLEPHPGLRAVASETLIDAIAEVLLRCQPKAVLTFPPNGSNGHPDHRETNRLTLAAFDRVGRWPDRLYYFAAPQPYAGLARPGFLDPDSIRRAHLSPTHVVDVGPLLEAKLRAIGNHRTQALSIAGFMRDAPERLLVETFHRERPAVPSGAVVESVLEL